MEEILLVHDKFYILHTSTIVDDRTRVLKHGDTFGVFDRYGDVQLVGRGDQGLYHQGTRFISQLNLRLCGDRPLLLSSTVKENNVLMNVDLTNPDIRSNDQISIPHGALHVYRAKFVFQNVCYERFRVSNFSLHPIEADLELQVKADFADIFEVRGSRRPRKGTTLDGRTSASEIVLTYIGLDQVTRRTRIQCAPEPQVLKADQITYSLKLAPKEEAVFLITVSCEIQQPGALQLSFDGALEKAELMMQAAEAKGCEITASNVQFNAWLSRSMTDLRTMITDTPHGPYPYAGIPWFSTVFGRDGIITALETLAFAPHIAHGVLSYLAATQATATNADQDAEPGKIIHEVRGGEMAALGEIPFGRYYGSVDATPLFVILAGAYYERSADRDFLQTLWPHIEAALEWCDQYGDRDRDGFVEYFKQSPKGLTQQGWKDSTDSVFHADGSLAEGPIALVEVQAYLYLAKLKAALVAEALDKRGRAETLRRQASQLQEKFERAFWCEELYTYALALDGQKRPCRVRTSNAGHALFAGIADPDRARRTADTLLSEEAFSGWGIRTVDSTEIRYNPMSYHNGSVWPHDNALIAQGFKRYGFQDKCQQVLSGLFDASKRVELNRLPELLCGFRRRLDESPTLYPVACSPQAWAAGTAHLLLQSVLGLTIDAVHKQISFLRPCLPPYLHELTFRRLPVADALLDVTLRGEGENVDIHIRRDKGSVEAVVYK